MTAPSVHFTDPASTPNASWYDLAAHGWHIRSTRPLPALRRAGMTSGGYDLAIEWSPRAALPPPADPTARLLVRCASGGRQRYTATARGEHHRLEFTGCATFDIDLAAGTAVCTPAPQVPIELTVVLAGGALPAYVMAVRRHCVLHASAVDVGGVAVAIVGASGFGKSTVTAALCATGLPLVSDDVLRVDVDADGTTITHRGARELRLRAGARELATRFQPPAPTRETADGRLAVAPPHTTQPTLRLGALVVPRPRPDRTHVKVTRVTPANAVHALLSYPRLYGWADADLLRLQLDQLASLARRAPMFVADLPLGPPFPIETAAELGERLAAIAH